MFGGFCFSGSQVFSNTGGYFGAFDKGITQLNGLEWGLWGNLLEIGGCCILLFSRGEVSASARTNM